MIDRNYGKIVFECDSCPEVLETEESDWWDAKVDFDRAGWVARKVGPDDWSHVCPKCGVVI